MLKGAIIGEGSLSELRQSFYQTESRLKGGISPKIAPFANVKDMGNLLAHSNFKEIITDRDVINISYKEPIKLLRDIKSQGLSSILAERSKTFMSKNLHSETMKYYQENFKAENSNTDKDNSPVNARIEIIYYSAMKA